MRRCSRCQESRPESDFYRDKSKASGYRSMCKVCDLARSRGYYAANREKVIARVVAGRRARA